MILCTENDNLTIYNKDFQAKRTPYKRWRTRGHETPDPIFCAFKQYLDVPDCKRKAARPTEDTEKFLERLKVERPNLYEKYFTVTPRYDYICQCYERDKFSTYQKCYCREDEIVQHGQTLLENEIVPLPKGWVIPATTQRLAFRDPAKLMKGIRKQEAIPPDGDSFFHLSDEMHKIMKTSTGETTYQKEICEPAEFVVERQMHGVIHI